MNESWQSQKPKNRQWRIIIWSSLFLIFGKDLGLWVYHGLGIDQAYTATASMASKVGMIDVLGTKKSLVTIPQLIIVVKNDTINEYTIDTKIVSGQIHFTGHTLSAGEAIRFTIKSQENTAEPIGAGDIVFISAPMTGNNSTTCQEIHTLNYDMKYVEQIKQPLNVNLSSIASKMECKDNTNS